MINWTITGMESHKDSGIVFSAKWKCYDEQINREGQSYFPEPVDTIIPYESLTEKDVLNWIWADGGVDKTIIEESIIKEINDLLNTIVVKNPLPWNK